MRVTLAVAVGLGLLLPGCETFDPSRLREPSAPPVTCPPSLKATVESEPLAPAGVDMAALPEGLGAWWFGEFIPWARTNAVRLDQGRTWCLKRETPPPDS